MSSIRANTLRISPDMLAARLADRFALEPVPWYPAAFRVDGEQPAATLEYMQGLFYVQSLASMLPVLALNPQPGERVLDLCAAPGSKTTQIAMHMENRGVLVANDSSYQRLKPLGGHLDRMGVLNGAIAYGSGQRFPRILSFDRVLVDAPCSGLGSRHTHTPFSPSRLRELERTQKKLLERAYDLLTPGGRLVYSTCTTREEENESVVRRLLDKREARIQRPSLPVSFDFDVGARVQLDEEFFVATIEKPSVDEENLSWGLEPSRGHRRDAEREKHASAGASGVLPPYGFERFLRQYFGLAIPEDLVLIERKNKVYLAVRELASLRWSGLQRKGILAGKQQTIFGPKPSLDLVLTLGDRASQNTVRFSEDTIRLLYQGESIPSAATGNGLRIVQNDQGRGAALGVSRNGSLHSLVPRSRQLKRSLAMPERSRCD